MFDSEDDALFHYDLATMNTGGQIKLAHKPEQAIKARQATVSRMDYLVEKLSKFNPSSDVSRINANPGAWVSVSKDTALVLSKGLRWMKESHGYFDMGMGNFLCLKGLDDTVAKVGINALSQTQLCETLLKIDGNMVYLERPNTMLDLGGIAKGYILEEMIKTLKQYGVQHAAIDIGGDLAVMGGRPNGQPWTVGLDPEAKVNHSEGIVFSLRDGGVASSGAYRKRAIDQHGKVKHHIIDPHSFSTHEYYALATAIGPSPMRADVLAKECFNTPPEDQSFFKSCHPGYELIAWPKVNESIIT
ncbi:MAG: FAD:protein FMN transferase [Legionellales bacterium]|nr:FAD:protein FMN transferase [Legionellales bacterium]